MSYLSLSDQDKKEMLARIGAASLDDLFCLSLIHISEPTRPY